MRCYALLVIATGMLGASAQADCTTPLGLPCMVVQFVDEQWSVLQTGIDYHHSRAYQQIAYASDGSVAREFRFENIPLFGSSEVFAPTAGLYLGASDLIVRIMHADRTFSRRAPVIWHDRPYRRAKANDPTCASGILHSGTDFALEGEHMILGMKTFQWYRSLGYGGYEEQFLAPALDCISLRTVRIYRNVLRIPVFSEHAEATSVQFGEPDRALFDIPADYKEVPDPSADRLKHFVEANKR